LGAKRHIDGEAAFTHALSGYKGDHSADQDNVASLLKDWKKSVDRRVRGERAISAMTNSEILHLYSEQLHETLQNTPGFAQMVPDEQDHLVRDAWTALFIKQGEKDFAALDADTQTQIDFFVRVGCAMHKDLNWTKGGEAAMRAAYAELEIKEVPIDLPNKAGAEAKQKAEASAQAEGAASQEEKESTLKAERKIRQAIKHAAVGKLSKASDVPRGGARLVGIAAACLNHSDDDRGEHNTWRWWMEEKTGTLTTFPDASNSRYRSLCDGAIILLLYRDETREYLTEMRLHKGSQQFVNIQKNIFEALDDPPTLTELAVLAGYAQAISRPFMAYVREHVNDNALLMGPTYERVKAHARAIADDPSLLFGDKASARTGSLFQTSSWDTPEVMYKICALKQQGLLPNLEPLFVAFMRGVIKTMERFTKEYAAGGEIATLTPRRQKRGRASLTNDENEGALAQYGALKRRYPTMSQAHINALLRANTNHVQDFEAEIIDKSPQRAEIEAYIRQRARQEDASGHEARERSEYLIQRKVTIAENNEKAEASKVTKDKKEKRLASITLMSIKSFACRKPSEIKSEELDAQIDKIRSHDPGLIPPKSSFKGTVDGQKPKQRKITCILEALKMLEKDSEALEEDQPLGEASKAADEVEGEEPESDDENMYFVDEVRL
jgi:hypothetical protein